MTLWDSMYLYISSETCGVMHLDSRTIWEDKTSSMDFAMKIYIPTVMKEDLFSQDVQECQKFNGLRISDSIKIIAPRNTLHHLK